MGGSRSLAWRFGNQSSFLRYCSQSGTLLISKAVRSCPLIMDKGKSHIAYETRVSDSQGSRSGLTSSTKKRFLITGASGFVGACLLRRLVENGQEVHVLLRRSARLWRITDLDGRFFAHECDLLDRDRVKQVIAEIQPAVIYHLAAYGAYSYQDDADQILKSNIDGTWNLLQACQTIDFELFVNTGSSSEYGFKKAPMKESDLLEPASYYAVAKAAQTLLCSHFARSQRRPVVTFRLFSVYGPYEEPTRLVPTLMKALHEGAPMKLVSPHIARDMIYVDDVVDAYLLIERLGGFTGEYFNIATGVQSSMSDIVQVSAQVSGRTTEFRWGSMEARSWDTDVWVAETGKARAQLDWVPRDNLSSGLKKTWDWFTKHWHLYQ